MGGAFQAAKPVNFFHNCPTTIGFCFQFDNSEKSWFDAGVIEVRRRMSSGLRFQASYQYGKSFTNAYASANTRSLVSVPATRAMRRTTHFATGRLTSRSRRSTCDMPSSLTRPGICRSVRAASTCLRHTGWRLRPGWMDAHADCSLAEWLSHPDGERTACWHDCQGTAGRDRCVLQPDRHSAPLFRLASCRRTSCEHYPGLLS